MARVRRTDPQDDLGLPWDRWGDGTVWRVKRGQEHDVESTVLQGAADAAAGRMGKVAVVAAERVPRMRRWDHYAWVQFVDHEVLVGDPCPCGSRHLVRTHPKYAHCDACGAHLRLTTPKEAEEFAAGAVASADEDAGRAKAIARGSFRCKWDERFTLEQYSDVRFLAHDVIDRRERLYGSAVDPLGMRVLIWVQYPLVAGRRPDPELVPAREARVHRWPVAPFGEIIDVRKLDGIPAPREPTSGAFTSEHPRQDRYGRTRLTTYSRSTLVFQEALPGRERWYGRALDGDGRPALIYVDYPLLEGARVPDRDDPDAALHQVYRWPISPFESVLDLSRLAA